MDSSSDSSTGAPALTVSPRSPPGSGALDLYGKRTQMVKVQALEREICLLQEELKSIEGLQPASTYCKEVADFVGIKQDPLVTINQKNHKSHSFCKKIWGRSCFFPLVYCCFSCRFHLKKPTFSPCCKSESKCLQCSCSDDSTGLKCYNCEEHSCFTHVCCRFRSFFHNCKKVNSCCGCGKASSSSCCQ